MKTFLLQEIDVSSVQELINFLESNPESEVTIVIASYGGDLMLVDILKDVILKECSRINFCVRYPTYSCATALVYFIKRYGYLKDFKSFQEIGTELAFQHPFYTTFDRFLDWFLVPNSGRNRIINLYAHLLPLSEFKKHVSPFYKWIRLLRDKGFSGRYKLQI